MITITTISPTILMSYTQMNRNRSVHKQMAYKRTVEKYKSSYIHHVRINIYLFTGHYHTELYSPLWH